MNKIDYHHYIFNYIVNKSAINNPSVSIRHELIVQQTG